MNSMVMHIPARQAISYPLYLGSDLLNQVELWLPKIYHDKRIVIITDDRVKKEYGETLLKALAVFTPLLFSFPAGETSKNYQNKQDLEEKMLAAQCDRDTLIIALGGGVVGDLSGFIAATYMRGIPYIQMPTTFLAMVDSSVGGKTAIDTQYGKNLIGAFWHPIAVVADLNCLKTLPQTQLINGLIEALKVFMTHDLENFNYAESHINEILKLEFPLPEKIIQAAVKIKMEVVSQDETENNLRMVLNFGHTIGHAIEKTMNYTILHGYAVALGILVEAKIAELSGFLSALEYRRIQTVFFQLEIEGSFLKTLDQEAILQATRTDKKSKAGSVRYVLLKKIGQVVSEENLFAHPVSDDIVRAALLAVSEESYVR